MNSSVNNTSGNNLNISGNANISTGQVASDNSQINTSGNNAPDDATTPQQQQMQEDDGQFEQQKVITFKNRDYLLYEGRIIDESEADRIYTQYHEMLT